MSAPTCTRCGRIIPAKELNASHDVVRCRRCNILIRFLSLFHKPESEKEYAASLGTPPSGAWHQNDALLTVIGATDRSLLTAAKWLILALFWNGMMSIFVYVTVACTLDLLHIPAPGWFPAAKANNGMTDWGLVTFLWLFETPFILAGLGMAWAFLLCLAGRTEVRIKGQNGLVFNGIGPLGWRNRFEISNVKSIKVVRERCGKSQYRTVIVLETRTNKHIKFGSMLTDERRVFVAEALRKTLRH